MPEKIIYTALYGPYEELKEPVVITPGWKYLCHTDQELESETWQIIKSFRDDDFSPQLAARVVKCGPKWEWDQSIWIDASFKINCNLNDFWNEHYKGGITAPKHPARRCIYREAEVCRRRNLDSDNVAKQITRYSKQGMPGHNGLISSGILLRDNSEPVKKFCELWWEQIVNGSVRDQIGFAYCQWKMPEVVNYIDYDYRVREEFLYFKHYNRR